MKIKFDRLAVFLILCLAISSQAFSQIDKPKLDRLKKELESRGGGLVSDLTSRRMTRAANELQAERYDRAMELLEGLVEATKSNRYESGLALQMLGVTYVQREQIDKGIKTLEQALAIDALPYEPTLNIYYTLAQIYLATEKYPQAKLKLQEWFYLARQVTPEAQILMGAVYAQEENYKKALEYVEKALAGAKEPQEAWLSFAAGLYYQADNLPKAAQMFELLTRMNPKEKRYWRQLSGIYITIDKEDAALSAMVMAQKMDLLSEDTDYFTLCSLYNYNAIPVNCARLIDTMVKEEKFENRDRALLLVSQAWVQAREPLKAVAYLREIAERKKDGKFDAQRGFIYYQLHRWKEAASAFGDALKRGDLEDSRKGDVLLSLGIAQYQQKQFTEAIETFTQAQALEDHTTSANAWLSEVKAKM